MELNKKQTAINTEITKLRADVQLLYADINYHQRQVDAKTREYLGKLDEISTLLIETTTENQAD